MNARRKSKRAVGYVRVSVDAADKISPDAQRKSIETYCTSKGWELADVVIERGRSAGEGKKRPKFERLVDSIDAGEYDVLVAYRLDRITRSTLDFADLSRRLSAADCDIASVSESFDTSTATGRAMLQIVVTFAELERASIMQRARDTNRQRRQSGNLTPHGTPAYGYTRTTKKHDNVAGSLVIDEDAAKWVRYITDRIIEGGTLRAICAELIAADAPVPPQTRNRALKSGKQPRWLFGGVREVAMSATVAGLRADLDGDDPTALVAGGWQPIVDAERWRDVVKVLTNPKRRWSKDNPPSLLSGHLICGGIGKDGKPCAAKLRPYTYKGEHHGRNGGGHDRRRYRCQISDVFPHACAGNSIDAAPVERYVVDRLLNGLDSSGAEIAPIDIDGGDDVDDITARLDELAADWAAGVITRSEWRTARAVLDQRLADVEQATRRQRSRQTMQLMSAQNVRDAWEQLDDDDRRAAVRDLLAPIVLAPTYGRRGVPVAERVSIEPAD